MSEIKHFQGLTDGDFQKIRQLVYDSIGVNLTEAKRALVVSRLARRLRELNLNTYGEYVAYLDTHPMELETLFNRITTNVTNFFRESYHFDYLREEGLPERERMIKKNGSKKVLRVWSAACSTGEEPYTLAMVLDTYFANKSDWQVKILASDINTQALQKAKEGIYSKKEVENIPYKNLVAYFKLGTGENKGLFKAKEKLQKYITFRQINLSGEKPYPFREPVDIIFCRNVFIYFNNETRNRILMRFSQMLRPGGLLFLGHSESMNSTVYQQGNWRLIKHTIYKKL